MSTAEKEIEVETAAGRLRRKEQRREALRSALVAAALGGTAYGSYRAGKWFLPDESLRSLESLRSAHGELLRSRVLSGQSNALDNKVIQSYAEHASRLANSPVAGVKGKDFVKFVRSSIPTRSPWRPFWSDAHYDAFAKGPAFGGAQLIDEHAHDMVAQGNGSPKLLKYMAGDFSEEYGKAVNDVAQRTAGSSLFSPDASLREGLAYGSQRIPEEDQKNVLKSILEDKKLNSPSRSWLGLKKEDGLGSATMSVKRDLSDALLNSSFKNYIKLGDYAKGVRSALTSAAPALLGIGTAGAAGYGLYKLLKSFSLTPTEKRRLRRKQMEEEQEKLASGGLIPKSVITKGLLAARKATDTKPSKAQAEAGNYAKGRVNFHGIKIAVENPKGSTRSGVSKSGKKWSTKMTADYGYVEKTTAADGDQVDVFIGPAVTSELVVAIDQYEGNKFDETKFILGVNSKEEGEKLYLSHYEKGWKLGPSRLITLDQFREWTKTGEHKKPFENQCLSK